MKNFLFKYSLAIGIYIVSVCIIYLHQQSQTLQKENLIKVKGIYKNLALKTERQYPAKLYLENDNNTYVLKRNAYKAWAKHYFLNTAKKGDELQFTIDKRYTELTTNQSPNIINMVSMINVNRRVSYLTLANYNSHQKASYFKLYLLVSIFLLVYLTIKNIKKRTYKM